MTMLQICIVCGDIDCLYHNESQLTHDLGQELSKYFAQNLDEEMDLDSDLDSIQTDESESDIIIECNVCKSIDCQNNVDCQVMKRIVNCSAQDFDLD